MVERYNWVLGDTLRSLFVSKSQEEWYVVLPQIMQAYHSTSHSSTQESSNFLIFGWEIGVPNYLSYHVPALKAPVHEYRGKLVEIMGQANDALWKKQ